MREAQRHLRYDFRDQQTRSLNVEPRRALAVYRALDLGEDTQASRMLLSFAGREDAVAPVTPVISAEDCDALAGRLRTHGYPLSDDGIRRFKMERGFSDVVRIGPDVAAAYARFARGVEARLNIDIEGWAGLDRPLKNALRLLLIIGRDPARLLAVRRSLGVRDSDQAPDGVILVGRVTAERLLAWGQVHGWTFDVAGMRQITKACAARSAGSGQVAHFVADAVTCRGEPLHDYARISRGGHTLNRRTVLMLRAGERLLGPTMQLRVIKGSYLSDAGRGAHPHLGGGVCDLTLDDAGEATVNEAVAVLRQVGFAAWFRARESMPHIHAVAIGDREVAPAAAWQVKAYFDGRDGRSRSERDPHHDLETALPDWAAKYRVPYL